MKEALILKWETAKFTLKKRYQNVAFSNLDDKFISAGSKKYGSAKWTSILNDSSYSFHHSRKASTLAIRAKSKNFI